MNKTTIQTKGSIVKTPAIVVMGCAVVGAKNSEAAFQAVEKKLGTMKGRKFYGLLYGKPDDGEYFACVEKLRDDDPKTLGLEVREIPAGMYARRKIRYWYEDIASIGSGFGILFDRYPHDTSRPTVEYYRSERDVYIFFPIKEA